jgi:hypothetical protein
MSRLLLTEPNTLAGPPSPWFFLHGFGGCDFKKIILIKI